MKKRLLIFLILTTSTIIAQTNKEIAEIYVKKAIKNLESLDYENALKDFNKAETYLDTITDYKFAELGILIHYDLNNFKKAKKYATSFFLLTQNYKPENYQEILEAYVTISEKLEEQKIKEEQERIRKEKEKIRKERELKIIDSLKNIWKEKATFFSINVDSIYPFNKDKIGLIKKEKYMGIISDLGVVYLEADTYKYAISFDRYILLLNKKDNPTKIYCFDSKSKKGAKMPPASDFNPTSTHYGQVMLPRGNGRVVSYPNNTAKTLIYDIDKNKFIRIANQKEVLKSLKKRNIIKNYNKEGAVKIDKKWNGLGGHLGGAIYSLYNENSTIYGFLFSANQENISTNTKYLGYYYNDAIQAIKGKKTVWENSDGKKVAAPKDESGVYTGNSKVVRNKDGKYQIWQKINGKEYLVIKNDKLEKMSNFLKNNIPENFK